MNEIIQGIPLFTLAMLVVAFSFSLTLLTVLVVSIVAARGQHEGEVSQRQPTRQPDSADYKRGV